MSNEIRSISFVLGEASAPSVGFMASKEEAEEALALWVSEDPKFDKIRVEGASGEVLVLDTDTIKGVLIAVPQQERKPAGNVIRGGTDAAKVH